MRILMTHIIVTHLQRHKQPVRHKLIKQRRVRPVVVLILYMRSSASGRVTINKFKVGCFCTFVFGVEVNKDCSTLLPVQSN